MAMDLERRIQEANRRIAIIRPLVLSGKITAEKYREAEIQLGVSRQTIRAWMKRFRQNPSIEALMPGHQLSTPRKPRFPEKTMEIISEQIQKRYLGRKEALPVRRLLEFIEDACEKAETPAPSLRQLYRIIKKLSKRQLAIAMKINKDPRSFEAYPHHHVVEWPGDQIQIDHTLVDAILDLSSYGLEKQRIWVTLAIDVATRMVFGYYLGIRRPNVQACGLALLLGVLPKKPWVESLGISYSEFHTQGIDDPWPMCEVPIEIANDNASEFKCPTYVSSCRQLGARVVYRPLGKAHYGGHIERLIGRFMKDVHMLPGTTFSRPQRRRKYPSGDAAFLTLEDFERWFVANLLEYHLTPHRGLNGLTPLQKYQQLMDARPARPRLIPDHIHVLSAFLPSVKRIVGRQGVSFQWRRYWNDQFRDLIGDQVVIKYHRARLDSVWVCLNGITPSFQAHLIGTKGRCQHMDALVDRLPDKAIRTETLRQEAVAKKLSLQKADMIERLQRQHRHPKEAPLLPRRKGTSFDTKPAPLVRRKG